MHERLISATKEPGGAFGVAYESMDSSSEDALEYELSSLVGNRLIGGVESLEISMPDGGGSGGGLCGTECIGGG